MLRFMAWIKSDTGNSGTMTILGEDKGCKLWLQGGDKPTFSVTLAGNPMRSVITPDINLNEWHHVTGSFSSSTGKMKIYVGWRIKEHL